MRLRKKMTAILLTAIFMVSAFALAMPVSAQVYEDFRDTEKVWGGPLEILQDGDGLAIEVWREGDFVYFKATVPLCYTPETSLTSFTFDVEPDGIADFQIQYRGTEGWMYSGVDLSQIPMGGSGWVKDIGGGETNWQLVPPEFTPGHTFESREFTLQVPVAILGGSDSDYKFGVQANGETSHQIFYSTDPAHLWGGNVNGGDYTHSDFYVPMTVPSPLPTQPTKADLVPGKGEGIENAPGLKKLPPNENFGGGNRQGPKPDEPEPGGLGPHGPNDNANEHAKANALKHGHGNGV